MRAATSVKALGEICEFKYGKSLPESVRIPGDYPVYGSNGVVGRHTDSITVGPTIVIGRKGSIGEINYSDTSCWPIDTTYYIDESCSSVDLKWLSHVLRSLRLNELNKAAAVPGLNRSDAYRKTLLVPPPSEQKRIAAILDAADTLRAKRRAALAKLDALAQAIFVEMFGDPATNPKQWIVDSFGNVAKNEDSRRVPIREADRAERHGPYPYYGASGIIDYFDSYIFEGERLLIGEDGANLIARSTPIAFIASGRYWVNNHAHVIAFNGRTTLRYLQHFFARIDLKPYVTGSAQPKLNRSKLDRIPVPVPPEALQLQFEAELDQLDQLRAVAARSHSFTNTLFASLQHRAFAGEL